MNNHQMNIMIILIDINSGEIVEFVDKEIEKLQNEVAKKLVTNLLIIN